MARFIDKYIEDKTRVSIREPGNDYFDVYILERDNDFICIREQCETNVRWININQICSIEQGD